MIVGHNALLQAVFNGLQCPLDRDNISASLILAKPNSGQQVENSLKNLQRCNRKKQQTEW